MEALFISYKHPPSIGGIQIQNKALVDTVEQTHRVHRLLWDHRSPLPLFLATDAIIDGGNGFHVAPGDADAWVSRLEGLLADPAARSRWGRLGREFTREHYSWKRMADGYRDVFRETSGGRFSASST